MFVIPSFFNFEVVKSSLIFAISIYLVQLYFMIYQNARFNNKKVQTKNLKERQLPLCQKHVEVRVCGNKARRSLYLFSFNDRLNQRYLKNGVLNIFAT